MSIEVVDAPIRTKALDPARSFIVQAPAGSGKTELLTRRILTLLASVDEPEEILAITFTRKAAAEMRQRVVQTLQAAFDRTPVTDDYSREGRMLAELVLKRDQQRQWQLLENPSRLGIQTIDSLCADLTRQLPVTSNFGAELGVLDDSTRLYLSAAERTITENLKPDSLGLDQLKTLLFHLDNNVDRLQHLLADMLANRDQWLRHNGQVSSREQMEADLSDLVGERFGALHSALPGSLCRALPPLLRHAVSCCQALGVTNPVSALADIEEVPLPALQSAAIWQLLGSVLLTQSGSVRKSVTRKDGFPTSAADAAKMGVDAGGLRDMKTTFVAVLDETRDNEMFAALLHETRQLPIWGYTDAQWEVLDCLLMLLKLSVAELHFVFAEARQVDFSEISLRASRALGDDESPTDLALALDYRLRHILVDEFQDTSISQYQLFAKLVTGWEAGDGRTFFAVGDPMQSIYRFRDAEVSLFVQASQLGIGNIVLEPLQLQVNFRSDPAIVDWCNTTFGRVFPAHIDLATGAIPYSPSSPIKVSQSVVGERRTSEAGSGEHFHAFIGDDRALQADWVAELVESALDNGSDNHGEEPGTVAILVRTKASLTEIFHALQQRQIAYQAIDIERLGDRLVVKDILSLCRALQHPQDRLHWLAVLRSPLCGLRLTDLHSLADDLQRATIWSRLTDEHVCQALSADGRSRVEQLSTVLEPAIERALREALVPWVEACWLAMGGPASCVSNADLLAADACFRELTRIEEEGLLWDSGYIDRRLSELFAPAMNATDVRVQIMTIHKSKGLEFDTVILPALGRRPRTDQSQLLNWFEYYDDDSAGSRLLLAPITETNRKGSEEPILSMITSLQKRKANNELLRLLYVAATRAKRHLHLVAHSNVKVDGDLAEPPASSLLHPLWPLVRDKFTAVLDGQFIVAGDDSDDEPLTPVAPRLKRTSLNWSPPDLRVNWVIPGNVAADPVDELEAVEYQWASSSARHVGSVVHRQLQRISEEGVALWKTDRVADMHNFYAVRLNRAGVPDDQLETAASSVVQALSNVLSDERGRWLLSNQQLEAKSELRITGMHEERLVNGVIDRTFVDEQNIRWIVDFKTGAHSGGRIDEFIEQEQKRYQPQLERYAAIMCDMEDREIRLGLYFPLHSIWREWSPEV